MQAHEPPLNLSRVATITLFDSAVQWYCFLLCGTAAGASRHEVIEHRTYAPGSDPRLAEITTGGLKPVPVIRQGAEELIGSSK